MKQREFRKILKEQYQVASEDIQKYIVQLKNQGHCYIEINGNQYLCIAKN